MPSLDEHARSQVILSELGATGRVEVNDLAQRLEVSTVTIRKDLDALEQRAVLRRVRGGAVAAPVVDEGSFETRLQVRRAEKTAIARAVAPLVGDGDVIALDSSTSCHFLARELLDRRSLVVITNSMPTATLFSERSEATVLVPGGIVRRSARSVVGLLGDVLAGRGRIGKGFIGAHSVSAERGLLDMTLEEAQAKQYLAAHCAQLFGLVDSSKFGNFSLHTATPVSQITALYTDSAADPAVVAELEQAGTRVHRVDVAEEHR
ncbi:DeoR/GlpR family DNA-binding transcription regulator [Geodermatophilus sabuli]|uniref:Transcriptional regulator, DeoR family n=1 Tax=Geodermatophilus sabuli TaxID=1564158 RepID=A0A285EJZ4_9ACTN|nr:DeoR/GlpR family DNA-binding transcription regulator [Geodermatophilus sabuli]MBB3083817.1 DeoR/GlpR family transcriptional regulator of sugar metabolism [Geodermatophilus sabuli]SNX99330.1 transcriptional regulator, DeoR family [Geodermatophilus sabuli]